MIFSNLRIETVPVEMGGGKSHSLIQTRVVCDVEAQYCKQTQLWFSVDECYGSMLSADVYDAFLVAAIYPAMYYGEDIEIEGPVSKRLYHNTKHYITGIVRQYRPQFHTVNIKVAGFADAAKSQEQHVGTGFSGGVDSFSTLHDHFFTTDDPDYKIDTLFFFHLGQYGNVAKPQTWERAFNRFGITKSFAKEIGIKAVMMNTNLFDFYRPEWEYMAGTFNRMTAILVLQRGLKRYYMSNSCTYGEMTDFFSTKNMVFLEDLDPLLLPLVSNATLDILCDGAQYRRTEKTVRIASNPLVQRHLNVCVNSTDAHIEATNCGYCSKCLRTMMALDSAGLLDKFATVFDISQWRRHAFAYKCEQVVQYRRQAFARDNVDFARQCGKSLPPVPVAYAAYGMMWAMRKARRAAGRLLRIAGIKR